MWIRIALLLSLAFLGCRATVELEPAPDLDAFDRAVGESFAARYESLEQAITTGADPRAVAEALAELGHWYTVYGFPGSAERCYRQAGRLDPEEARWPYFLGHVLFATSELDESREAFSRALERAPDSLPARLRLAEAELEAGHSEQAEKLFRQALDMESGCALAEAGLGRLALGQGDFVAAAGHFERALSIQPGASALFYPLSRAYHGLGDSREFEVLAKVSDENRQLVEIRVNDPWLQELGQARDGVLHHIRAGKKARRAGRMADALEHFRRGVAADDENIDARLEVAITLGEIGRSPAAIRELEDALRSFPDHPRVHFFLGTLLLKARRTQDAEHHLRASLALDSESATVHFNLAQALRSGGRLEPAIEHYRQAQELNPRMARAAFWQAVCLLGSGEQISLAIEPLEKVQLAAPENTDAASLLARVLALGGRSDSALDLVAGLPSHHVLSAESVAMVLASSGQRERAVAWQRAALQAVEAAANPICADDLVRRRLELYEAGHRPGEPWNTSEVVCELPVQIPG